MREGMLASASSPLYNFRIRKCENVREDKLRDFLEGGGGLFSSHTIIFIHHIETMDTNLKY
jgi:hypothetical protein